MSAVWQDGHADAPFEKQAWQEAQTISLIRTLLFDFWEKLHF
jgi:hypothetical protein